MKQFRKIIGALFLLVLFIAYQASITAFTHVHYVNGVLVTHSHPFHNKHSHSDASLLVIGLLSHFISSEPDCCEQLHPMCPLLTVLRVESGSVAVKGKAYRVISLRAPPSSIIL
ncbi:hypothetical protein [Bacteroides cutis]|uniref:hypothetical protein n=1 Tax=Bacteroides cutis TaxID=2024197 RepID=UPI0023A83D78|nr:hypothetical protein [Bacteroides cutis]